MNTIRSNNNLWDICVPTAASICNQARKDGLDINSTIYPFRVLVSPNVIDIEDWEDTVDYITIAIYNLSLYYISKNMPAILNSKTLAL